MREFLNALTFRLPLSGCFSLRYLKTPFLPLIVTYRLIKAWFKAEKLLKY